MKRNRRWLSTGLLCGSLAGLGAAGGCAPRGLQAEASEARAISAEVYASFLAGERALALGDAEAAREAFLRADPEGQPFVLARLVMAEAALGRREEAAAALERGLEAHPDSAPLRLSEARLLAQAGAREEALEAYGVAARLARAEGPEAEGQVVLEAAELAGAGEAARAILGAYLEATERPLPAAAALELELALEAGEAPPRLQAAAGRLHGLAPRYDESLRRWAGAALEAGEPARALALLEPLERDPSDVAVFLRALAAVEGPEAALAELDMMRDELVGGDLGRGELALTLGQVELARELAEAALRLAPEPRATLLLGRALRAQGRTREAIVALSRIPAGVSVSEAATEELAAARLAAE